jgi:hypothetical protein
LVGWFALAVDGIKLVGEAWELGGQKLADYVAISDKAAASGISTDLFQRIVKASEDAKVPVDALTTALSNLEKASERQLGTVDSQGKVTAGNSAQARLDQLIDAGNFQGNTGVGDLKNATDNESKYRAVLSLIDQAVDSGQRLAALDVAKTFLGQPAASAIAKSASSAKDMLESIDKISSETLTSQADVDRANLLKKNYDDAVAILEQRWHPIQNLLAAGGIEMQAGWVNIVSNIASGVDWATKLVEKLGEAPPWFIRNLNEGATAFLNATTTPESRAASEKYFGIESLQYGPQLPPAASFQDRLGPFGGTASLTARNIKDSPLFKDTSNPIPNPGSGANAGDAYGRAIDSIQKYIETTNAASLSVSDAASQQEKFKAIAELTAAGMKDHLTPQAARLRAEMSGLGDQAGAAAEALAKAREVSAIDFAGKTAWLSSDDVAIATQLKGIYGNDVPAALNSTYAAGIRVNNAFKEISSAIETNLTSGLTDIATGAATAGAAFSNMGLAIVKAIEQMIIKITIVQPLMNALQSSIGGNSGILGLLGLGGATGAVNANGSIVGAIGPTSVGGAPLVSGFHMGGIVGSEPTFNRYVHPSYFEDAPRFHTGGIAGDEIPIIAKKGEGVFTPGQMAAMGGSNQPAMNVTYAPNVDARGADAQAVARLAKALSDDRKNFETHVTSVMSRYRANTPGSNR